MAVLAEVITEPTQPVIVVGIGADGWPGLAPVGREALAAAEVVIGSSRQLALLSDHVSAECVELPVPLVQGLPGLLDEYRSRRICVLASGDPMYFGIGATLVRLLGPESVSVLPGVSSVSLACAQTGWPLEDVTVISTVGRPLETVYPVIQPNRRLIVLSADRRTSARLASALRARNFGPSTMVLLERMGTPTEAVTAGTADEWSVGEHDRLAIVAIECRATAVAEVLSTVPGLPDASFDSDGQMTKREVRAVTLSALRPLPHQVLWDVGAGTGTVGIEWMRTHPGCRAIAIEPRADRCRRIVGNAANLGVPGIEVVRGRAPEALEDLSLPDAVFVGGAVSTPGVLDRCLAALNVGGRLVANAVTVEAEAVLAAWHERLGGELIRVAVQRAAPVGAFTGWRPAMPVTQWAYIKKESP